MKSPNEPTLIEFTVDTPSLLAEIKREFSHGRNAVPGIVIGLDELKVGFIRIAGRAIDINDAVLLKELERLGIVHPTKTNKDHTKRRK